MNISEVKQKEAIQLVESLFGTICSLALQGKTERYLEDSEKDEIREQRQLAGEKVNRLIEILQGETQEAIMPRKDHFPVKDSDWEPGGKHFVAACNCLYP